SLGVASPEPQELGESNGLRRHVVEVMIARRTWEHGLLQGLAVLSLGDHRPTLRTEERLMGTEAHHMCPFAQRILELPSGNQASHMSSIIARCGTDLDYCLGQLLDWVREKEEAPAKHDYLQSLPRILYGLQLLLGLVHV